MPMMFALTGTAASGDALLELVTSAITTVISWVGTFITALVTESGALYVLAPLFAIGIAISAILLGVKIVKSIVWGA